MTPHHTCGGRSVNGRTHHTISRNQLPQQLQPTLQTTITHNLLGPTAYNTNQAIRHKLSTLITTAHFPDTDESLVNCKPRQRN